MPGRSVFVLLTLLIAAGMPAAACEKTLRWNEDPPFAMRGADGEVTGLTVDMVRENLRRMGCSVRLVEMPWARALAELEAGRLDILPGTVRTPERERFAHFSRPGSQSGNVLFTHARDAGRWHFAELKDLRGSGFRLGAQIGVNYGPEFERLMADPAFSQQVTRSSTRRNLWLMMDAGRLDGVVASEATGRTELARLGLQERIRTSGLALPRGTASVAFSRKSVPAEFVARYDQINEAMIKDGSHEAIVRKYGLR